MPQELYYDILYNNGWKGRSCVKKSIENMEKHSFFDEIEFGNYIIT